MTRTQFRPIDVFHAALRIGLLTLALFVPMIAMQQVQAGASTIIENTYNRSSGAGLVIVVSLQRA
jgi:hypothetical protein